jgi:hypothetical protein
MLMVALSILCVSGQTAWARTVLAPGALFEAEDQSLDQTGGAYNLGGFLAFWGAGSVRLSLEIPEAGYYKLLIRGFGQPAKGVWPLLEATDQLYQYYTWNVDSNNPNLLVLASIATYFEPGTYQLTLNYKNDFYDSATKEDRNLLLDWFLLVPVSGPAGDPDPDMLVKEQPLSSYGPLRQGTDVGRHNLLSDPDFENSSSGWYSFKSGGADGTYTVKYRDTEEVKFSGHSCSLAVTNSATTIKLVSGELVPAPRQYNKDLIYSGWAKRAPGTTARAVAEFICRKADNNYAFLSKEIGFTSDNWQYFQFTFRATELPGNIAYIMPNLYVNRGEGKIYFDGIALYPASDLVPEVPIALAAQNIEGKISLSWQAQEHNRLYEIHRGSAPDFPLTDSSLIATVTGANIWLDENPGLGTLAYYKIRSINDFFAPNESNAACNDLVPPNPLPQAPELSDALGGNLILSWLPPAPASDGERAAKYLIYRAQDSGQVGSGSPVATILEDTTKQAFTWRDRNVVPGESYYYAVKCEDRAGNTNNLSAVVGPGVPRPDLEKPNPPLNAGISAAVRGALRLTWQRPLPAAGDEDLPEEYYILRSSQSYPDLETMLEADPALLAELKIAQVQANGAENFQHLDPAVAVGATYYYHVLSVDKARNWQASGELTETVLAAAVPVAVSPQLPDVVANQPVSFSWDAPVVDYDDVVASYTLEYAPSADFSDAAAIAEIAGTQFTLSEGTVLAPGTIYWRVRAHYASGVAGGFSRPAAFDVADVGNARFPAPYFNLLPRLVRDRESIALTYVLDKDGWVTVKIFDSRGKLVRTLLPRQWQPAKSGDEYGVSKIIWDGRDQQGKLLVDGLYIGQLVLEQPDSRPQVLYRRIQVYRAQ